MNYNNIKNKIKNKYNNSFDVKFNDFNNIHLIYIDSLCNSNIINETILKNVVIDKDFRSIKDVITNSNTIDIKSIDEVYNYLENGFCIVCYSTDIVAVDTKKNLSRSISEPTIEQTINGPKDSLNEDYMTNIGLIRKRIKSICDTFNDTLGTDGQSVTINNIETVENAISGEVKHVFNLIKGMGKDIAQAIEDDIKELKLKVKTDIHANGVKVTGPKEEMQNVINLITNNQAKYKTPIQITNYNEEK